MYIKARFVANYIQENGSPKTSEIVHFNAVYSSDPSNPNYSYSKATPGAYMNMTVSNPDAFGIFKQG